MEEKNDTIVAPLSVSLAVSITKGKGKSIYSRILHLERMSIFNLTYI